MTKGIAIGDVYLAEESVASGSSGYNYNDLTYDNDIIGTASSNASLTLSHETASPLVGLGSLKISKAASDLSGEYVVLKQFTVDSIHSDPAMFTIEFGYKVSANYVDEDMEVYVYDVTNAKEIAVTPQGILASSLNKLFQGSFQTSANGSVYEVRVRVDSVSALTYDITIDGFTDRQWFVGPKSVAVGTVNQYLGELETTGSWTGGVDYTGKYWRNGEFLEASVYVNVSTAPTPAATNLTIDLPNSLSIDTTKLAGGASLSNMNIGDVTFLDAGIGWGKGSVRYNTPNSLQLLYLSVTSSSDSDSMKSIYNEAPMTFSGGDIVIINYRVPIQGWGASAQVSTTDAGARDISVSYNSNTPQTIPNNTLTIVNFEDKITDTANAVTTGASWKFTSPETGRYQVSSGIMGGTAAAVTSNCYTYIYKNGSKIRQKQHTTTNAYALSYGISASVDLEKGDYIDIRVYQGTGSSNNLTTTTEAHYVDIHKIQSPQQIAASEKVVAVYNVANESIDNSVTHRIVYTNKIIDTHNAVTFTNWATEDWLFTAPKSGYYRVSAKFTTQCDWGAGQSQVVYIMKNGVAYSNEAWTAQTTTTNTTLTSSSNDVVYLDKGDTIYINGYQASGASEQTSTNPTYNQVSINSL